MIKKDEFNLATIKLYWITEAEEALTVADYLFEKADYSYALFFGHLSVEKLLKAIYVERQKNMPRLCTTCQDLPGWQG